MKKEWRMVCKAVVTLTLLLLLLLSMISMRTELGRQTEEKEREPERIEIRNAWVVELTEEEITYFADGQTRQADCSVNMLESMGTGEGQIDRRGEFVADLFLADGIMERCVPKNDKVRGKLLSVTKEKIRLEEKGILTVSPDIRIYRLYGSLQELSLTDLIIGDDNVDYIIEDGSVCAALVTEKETFENIRVLIRADQYEGMFHEQAAVNADCAYRIEYDDEDGQEMTQNYTAGQEEVITSDSPYFAHSETIRICPEVNTGKFCLPELKRVRENPVYRGNLEITLSGEGLLIVNELSLEEYLYSVVPSEMPASYPMEALKAQAVCARTYAYRNMQHAGLPGWGAHVDDSTAFQVYGNTEEQPETTEAVEATRGQILFYQEEPVDAYYYSTSCGFGTDTRAWNGTDTETVPYLLAKKISVPEAEPAVAEGTGEDRTEKTEDEQSEAVKVTPEELQAEERFEAVIRSKDPEDYECDEVWYRWQYCVDEIDVDEMEERLRQRYDVQPQFILTQNKDQDYISEQPGRIGKLHELKILSRNAGGNAARLLIKGTEGTYLVQTEYNIRYLLANGHHCATKQDGSEAEVNTLLPSAFFVLETGKEGETVVGYSIIGGGYGHGIGMSQNGARHMALSGLQAEEILAFFYEGSHVENVY